MGTRSKNFPSGSLRAIICGASPISILWLQHLVIGGTPTCNACWFRAYMSFQRTEDSCSNPGRYCYQTPTITNSAKGHSMILLCHFLHRVGNIVRLMNSMSMGPLWQFICCEVRLLFRSNAVWNVVIVDKKFSKSMDGSFCRSSAWREGKPLSK